MACSPRGETPYRIQHLQEQNPVDVEIQRDNSWSKDDKSINIYITVSYAEKKINLFSSIRPKVWAQNKEKKLCGYFWARQAKTGYFFVDLFVLRINLFCLCDTKRPTRQNRLIHKTELVIKKKLF